MQPGLLQTHRIRGEHRGLLAVRQRCPCTADRQTTARRYGSIPGQLPIAWLVNEARCKRLTSVGRPASGRGFPRSAKSVEARSEDAAQASAVAASKPRRLLLIP